MFAKDVPICIPVSGSVLVDIIVITSVYCAKMFSVLFFFKEYINRFSFILAVIGIFLLHLCAFGHAFMYY